jgi:sortase B
MRYNKPMKKGILTILLLICLGIAGFSGYKLFEIYQVKQTVANETKELQNIATSSKKEEEESEEHVSSSNLNWTALHEENEDIVGWLYMPSLSLSFPVVQGENNDFYLNRTVKGEYNALGSIFLNAYSSRDFSDDNSIIYGHSVEGGGMFTDLKKFENTSFFDENPYYYFLTEEQNYRVEIMAFSQTTEQSAYYYTSFGDEKEEVISEIYKYADNSREVDIDGYQLLTLSTCNLDYGFHSNQRNVLIGVMVPYNEMITVE